MSNEKKYFVEIPQKHIREYTNLEGKLVASTYVGQPLISEQQMKERFGDVEQKYTLFKSIEGIHPCGYFLVQRLYEGYKIELIKTDKGFIVHGYKKEKTLQEKLKEIIGKDLNEDEIERVRKELV